MSAILQNDDLKVGMIVTVFKGAMQQKEVGGVFSFGGTQTVARESDYCKGSCLKIEAIQFPYILTSNLQHPTLDTTSWDIRETKFMELPNDYIEAKLPRKG